MKKMMLPVLSIFILLSPPGLPAFPGHISEMSKKASHFKDSDSVILLEEVEFRLRPDGRISRRHHVVRLLLTEYAVNMLNDPKIKYNSAKEDLNIIRSRTYTAGSGEIDTGINGFNPITPFELEKAPFYTNFKEMIVTHIGVEKGAVTELDYETTDKEPWRAFAGAIILSGKEPYAAKNIKITVPDGVKLYFRFIDPSGTFGNAPLAQVSSKGGETVYSWRVENIEPSESFSDAPPGFYPVLYFSTETPAGADVKFLNSLCQIEAGKYIKEKTAAIIVKSLSSSEKLSKILDYLSERINPVAWYAQDIYAQARDGDEIILSGYGTIYERTKLLCSMLGASGFEVRPFFMSDLYEVPKDIFIPWLFDRIYLQVGDGNRVLGFLDAGAARFFPADILDAVVYKKWEFDPVGKTIKLQDKAPAAKSSARVSLDFEITDALAVSGSGSFSLTGTYNPYFAVSKDEKGFDGLAKKIASSLFSDAALASIAQENVSIEEMRGKFKFSADMTKPAGKRFFFFKGSQLKSAIAGAYAPQLVPGRKTPVKTSGISSEVFEIKVKLPKKVKASFFTKSGKNASNAGKVVITSGLDEDTFMIKYEFEIVENYAPQDEIVKLLTDAEFAFCLEIL